MWSANRNRGPLLSAVTYTLFAVSSIFTAARALSRTPQLAGAGFGWDDYTALAAYVLLTGMTAGDWFAIHYGKGRYIYTLDADSVSSFLFWFYICNVLYTVAIFLTKISLVLLYLRLWTNPKGLPSQFNSICLLSLFGLAATMIAFTVVCIAQCLPMSYVWSFIGGGTGSCIDRTSWVWALSGVEIGWDLIVILLPIPKLLGLNISNQRKIGICLVFLVGLVVTICSFVRLKYIHGFTKHENFTYFYSYIGLWSSVEVYLSQVCCCMPATAGLVRRSSTYLKQLSHRGSRSESPPGATVLSETKSTIFDPPSSSRGTDDIENYSTSRNSSAHESRSQDSAPSPVISLRPGQRSPSPPPTPRMHPSRALITTHHDIGGNHGAPDILRHDHFNSVHLELTDPPESPIKAQLRYVDRNMVPHDVELRGEHRLPSTLRPSDSHPPSERAKKPVPRTISSDLVPFAREKPSWDTLKE